MNTTKIEVGIGHLSSGHPATGIAVREAGYAGFQAWRARPTTGAKSVLGGLVMTDAPVTKPQLVSASERCP
ncbi:MAG TPA: hypothetical protein VL595_31465 [Pseudonocardia sp.]|jgi:hypothetical protein|nr:hypothetical protein [Pseudonocardia sp.]